MVETMRAVGKSLSPKAVKVLPYDIYMASRRPTPHIVHTPFDVFPSYLLIF